MLYRWTIWVSPEAMAQSRQLPRAVRVDVVNGFMALAKEPRPEGATVIHTQKQIWFIEVAGYWVAYRLVPDERKVVVLKIRERVDD